MPLFRTKLTFEWPISYVWIWVYYSMSNNYLIVYLCSNIKKGPTGARKFTSCVGIMRRAFGAANYTDINTSGSVKTIYFANISSAERLQRTGWSIHLCIISLNPGLMLYEWRRSDLMPHSQTDQGKALWAVRHEDWISHTRGPRDYPVFELIAFNCNYGKVIKWFVNLRVRSAT